jgi:hypothetical protein
MQDTTSTCGHHQVVGVEHGLFAGLHLITGFFAVSLGAPHATTTTHRPAAKEQPTAGRAAANDSAKFQQSIAMAGHAYIIPTSIRY